MTSEGTEGIRALSNTEIDNSKSYILTESPVKTISIKQGIDDLPCKMSICFETKNIILYSGEIYDKSDGNFDYRINDEMILVFTNEKQAIKFENLSNNQ